MRKGSGPVLFESSALKSRRPRPWQLGCSSTLEMIFGQKRMGLHCRWSNQKNRKKQYGIEIMQ